MSDETKESYVERKRKELLARIDNVLKRAAEDGADRMTNVSVNAFDLQRLFNMVQK